MCPPEALKSLKSSTTSPSSIPAIVPPTTLSQSAYSHAASLLHHSILNHSIRLYIYTKTLAAAENSVYHTDPAKHDQLFVACLFHDIGTTETYNGPQRFEVEGADAAVAHLSKFGVSEEDKLQVWYAIALHTCKGIVQRMGELPALMRRALDVEFSVGVWQDEEGIEDVAEFRAKLEKTYPRMDIEKVLGDAVALQAVGRPEKAPSATWPGGLYRAHLEDPDWKGVSKAF
ncbi:hypothetical protein DPSP01_008552 [Paraphaeosphaeria sporulosa]|uniref:HD/PDEase domain-containing protein n=1 Tax=Paraphaeosphaeria sporulosa TaxID=1460663 RepID=A0A177CSD4_9PLEO|nr:uncharacterized protein CC84DRAFT_450925 [Paraphaeosphaeria sporulosa]OAG09687.1 hypothetical protein CC84DRAFT_450925 [Paraphaeosphaeria sporulosa]